MSGRKIRVAVTLVVEIDPEAYGREYYGVVPGDASFLPDEIREDIEERFRGAAENALSPFLFAGPVTIRERKR